MKCRRICPSSASHPLYYLHMVVGDTKGGTHQSAGRSERRRMASVKSGGSDGDFERFIFGRSGVGPIGVLLSFYDDDDDAFFLINERREGKDVKRRL